MSRINVANFRHPDGTSDNINLTDTGRVGVNESAPDRALHVNSANQNECAKFESTDTEVTLEFTDTTGTAALKCRNDFRFNTSSSTEICRIESGGNLQFNSGYGSVATAYGCRAWVNMTAAGGNPTIQSAGNVSSITDNGSADYTANWTTAMSDANYCVVTGARDWRIVGRHESTTQTTSSWRMTVRNGNSGTDDDLNYICLAVFR